MPGRKITDAEDARICLELAAASGLTQVAWAQLNAIDARSLHMWRMNLSRCKAKPGPRRSGDAPLRLVELVPAPAASRSARYLVHLGDRAVEVDDQFDADVLRRLLEVVTTC